MAGELSRRNGANVLLDEDPMQETQDKRRVVGPQKPPRPAVRSEPDNIIELHAASHVHIVSGGSDKRRWMS
jgi:hypothetical protein